MSVDCKATLEELEKLLVNGFEYLDQICQDTPAVSGEGKTLAGLLLDFFQYDSKKMLYVVLWATSKEIENTNSEDIVFRESNVQTELMFGYFYAKRGMEYLGDLLIPLITTIHKHSLTCQIDPTSSASECKRYYDGMTEPLQSFVTRFVNLDAVPEEFQRVFRHMKKEMNNRFSTSEHQFIVLSLLFLRVICPAIINPSLLKLDITMSVQTQRALVCCARVLQSLANFSSFVAPPMNHFDSFLASNRGTVKDFFLKLTMESADGRNAAPPKKKKVKVVTDKNSALSAILQLLRGNCLDKLERRSRLTMSMSETEQFMNLYQSKWKVYKKRTDSETSKNLENSGAASKLSAIVRASVFKVFEYFKQYERSLSLWPNLLKSKIEKVHDDCHVDMSVQVKAGFPFGGIREFNFSRYDRFEHLSEDYQRAMVLAFSLHKPENPEENVKRSSFKTSGLLIESMKDNKEWCWFHLIVSLNKKDVPSYVDLLQYSVLETIRKECELSLFD